VIWQAAVRVAVVVVVVVVVAQTQTVAIGAGVGAGAVHGAGHGAVGRRRRLLAHRQGVLLLLVAGVAGAEMRAGSMWRGRRPWWLDGRHCWRPIARTQTVSERITP